MIKYWFLDEAARGPGFDEIKAYPRQDRVRAIGINSSMLGPSLASTPSKGSAASHGSLRNTFEFQSTCASLWMPQHPLHSTSNGLVHKRLLLLDDSVHLAAAQDAESSNRKYNTTQPSVVLDSRPETGSEQRSFPNALDAMRHADMSSHNVYDNPPSWRPGSSNKQVVVPLSAAELYLEYEEQDAVIKVS